MAIDPRAQRALNRLGLMPKSGALAAADIRSVLLADLDDPSAGQINKAELLGVGAQVVGDDQRAELASDLLEGVVADRAPRVVGIGEVRLARERREEGPRRGEHDLAIGTSLR